MKRRVPGADRFFHCDFSVREKIGEWRFKEEGRAEAVFTTSKDKTVILLIFSNERALVGEYILDGVRYPYTWGAAETAYMSEHGPVMAFRRRLAAGSHRIEIPWEFDPKAPPEWTADIIVTLERGSVKEESGGAESDRRVSYPKAAVFKPREEIPIKGFRQGVGGGKVSVGRFGYTKGDGLLDCAMTTLGCLNRMYLFGIPLYQKTTLWQYSLLPKGIAPESKYHGSFPPAQVGPENDEVKISYLGASWKTVFKRPGGKDIRFGCSYSLASAAVMIETDDDRLCLSELQHVGNYRRVMLPLEKGLTVRDISSGERAYSRAADGELKENWFLLFGASAFPDIPIQIIMTIRPEEISLSREDGLLSGAEIRTRGEFGAGFAVSPFGIESLKEGETLNEAFFQDAYTRCNFWSHVALAFPCDAEEFYRVDAEKETVSVVQKYKYRVFQDEWGTEPLKTAPLPPALALTADLKGFEVDKNAVDFKFPTKYGPLTGVVNADSSGYTIPFIPERRRIDFRPAWDKTIAAELMDGFKEYWDFMEGFAPDEFPLSPYCASYLERYKFTRLMLNYIEEPYRSGLIERLGKNAPLAAEPDRKFNLLCGIEFGRLTKSDADTKTVAQIFKEAKRKTFYNWYERREPFTGETYKQTYVNCCVANAIKDGPRRIISKEIIGTELASTPMIEVDWGTGLSLNAIADAALASGCWDALRKNWDTLREGFKYFHLYQDWACMCAAYAENGASWVEGSSYNAFTSFSRLAKVIGAREDLELGRYLGAKHGACRLAIFRSSYKYFHKYFHRPPWRIVNHFHDEANPGASFQNAPYIGDDGEDFRLGGFFNIATEGAYAEAYMLYLKHIPDEYLEAWKYYRDSIEAGQLDLKLDPPFAVVECHAGYLLSLALSGKLDARGLEDEIAFAEKHGIMLREWFGLHYPVRRTPKNCFQSYLKSIVAAKDFPVWLQHWTGLSFKDAVYDSARKTASLTIESVSPDALLECGAREAPAKVTLGGVSLDFKFDPGKKRLTLRPEKTGVLSIEFTC